MIKYIKGKLSMFLDTSIVVEIESGIGFEIFVPKGSSLYQNSLGDSIKVLTYMIVKEDDMSLYGFEDKDNLDMFKKLIGVNGVGPKAALSIMGNLSLSELKKAIVYEDTKAISSANGIGKKIADRIILELRDKIEIDGLDVAEAGSMISSGKVDDARSEAISALVALGYSKNEAFNAVSSVTHEGLTSEEYIKKALKNLF